MTTIIATLPERVKGTILAPKRRESWRMSVLNFRWPIDLALTVASHGWVQLAPWRWDPEAGRLARIERIGDRCGTVEVVQRTSCAVIITWEGLGAAALSS